jgi:hypothetical protein
MNRRVTRYDRYLARISFRPERRLPSRLREGLGVG